MFLYIITFPCVLWCWVWSHTYNVDMLKHDHYYTWTTNAWAYTIIHSLSTFFFSSYTVPLQFSFQVYSMFAAYHIERINTTRAIPQLVCGVLLTSLGLTQLSTHTLFTFRCFQYTINDNVDKWRLIEFLYALFFMPTAVQRIGTSTLLVISYLLT